MWKEIENGKRARAEEFTWKICGCARKSRRSKWRNASRIKNLRPQRVARRQGAAISSCLAGNVDLEGSRDTVHQLGRDFILAHNLDRLGKVDASLINFKTLSGERLGDVAGGNGPE